MKHLRSIRAAILLLALCMIFSSCSFLPEIPSLPSDAPKTSESIVEPSGTETTDATRDTVLTTDETTAIFITTGTETTDTEETTAPETEVETNAPEIEDIPFVKGEYASSDGYNALLSFENGEDMQLVYGRLKALADKIHASEEIDAYPLEINATDTVENIIGSVPYPSTISQEELFLVFNMFRADNPIYYWINNQIIFSSKDLYIMTVDDYANGEIRKGYSTIIETKINEYLNAVKNETSAYKKALYFHDTIIKNMDYAANDQGIMFEGLKYHNILGAFVEGSGVCESYAKAFQLLLNASNIENCYVIGVSGTVMASGIGHVWNMIKLDDGKWYYCDLTWDDLGEDGDGIHYNNFCAGSETDINEGFVGDPATFEAEHIENLPSGTGEDFLYALPVASETKYIPET
ncbi:MAG: hypothetical protein IKL59_02435 [Clostridia bacterium]|nr:hypothetical protein [Clostridia bacterium]